MALDRSLFRKLALVAAAAAFLAGCADASRTSMRAYSQLPPKLLAEMKAKGMTRSSPILVRVYKKEAELEVWKQTAGGRYALLKSYPICRWSGQLGPKKVEGDRQVPEGFYAVGPSQMNPNSKYYLSFDVGYPNNFDRQLGRAGGDIMVHGSCSSRGCFAMTDDEMGEIYALAREALQGGQPNFQIQSLPFRMTAENMTRNRRNPNYGFWQNLKEGADNFEVTKQPVEVAACGGRYVFNGQGGCGTTGDPAVASAVAAKRHGDEVQMAALARSIPAENVIYDDGGSHPAFAGRSVNTRSIPGRDRPYYSVARPTVVVLNEKGAPATPADDVAARKATYSAAETLLMAEANLARRPVGPQKPEIVAKRQQTVYARLMGNTMPKVVEAKPEVKPAPVQETVVAANAPPVMADPAAPAEEKPFFARMLGFASTDPAPAPATTASAPPAIMAPAAAPRAAAPVTVVASAKPVLAPAAPVQATAGGITTVPRSEPQDGRPFYQRWLGLGGDAPKVSETVPAEPAADAAAPEAPGAPVPLPPARGKARTAGLTPGGDADAY